MSFRINSASFFLTYPQCPLPTQEAISQLIYDNHPHVKEYIAAEETHQDGSPHLHVYLLMKKKKNIKNPRHFDLTGPFTETYHGNYQNARSRTKVLRYIMKTGVYDTNIPTWDLPTISTASKSWKEMIHLVQAGKTQEYMSRMVTDHPREFVMQQTNVLSFCSMYRPRKNNSFLTWKDVKVNSIPRWKNEKTLILWGESGVGKTSLAKLLLPKALLVSHIDGLKQYRSAETGGSMDGIIFDDMSFLHLPREAQIHLVDNYEERQIHCRHTCAEIPAGTWKILTTNLRPYQVLKTTEAAIQRRIMVVEVIKTVKGKVKLVNYGKNLTDPRGTTMTDLIETTSRS